MENNLTSGNSVSEGLATAFGSLVSVLSALEHFCGLRKQNDWWQYKMDNKKLFRIGEMAKLFHLSVQTLRHCQLPTT